MIESWNCSEAEPRDTAGAMGAEVRAILAEAVREPDAGLNLAEAIMARFQGLEGDLELPDRTGELPRAAEFDT
jgi:hypothetical protein